MKIVKIQDHKQNKKVQKEYSAISLKQKKKSIYVCLSNSDTILKKVNNPKPEKKRPSLYAAVLWSTADVGDLICKGLGHPLSIWELAFCRF